MANRYLTERVAASAAPQLGQRPSRQTGLFAQLIRTLGLDIRVIGVGGISTAEHVREYLAAGVEATHIATAAMVDPSVAISIRHQLSEGGTDRA